MNHALVPVALIAGSALVISVFIWQVFATARRDDPRTQPDEATTLLRRIADEQERMSSALAVLAGGSERPPPASSAHGSRQG